jgi:hypothetical protein
MDQLLGQAVAHISHQDLHRVSLVEGHANQLLVILQVVRDVATHPPVSVCVEGRALYVRDIILLDSLEQPDAADLHEVAVLERVRCVPLVVLLRVKVYHAFRVAEDHAALLLGELFSGLNLPPEDLLRLLYVSIRQGLLCYFWLA